MGVLAAVKQAPARQEAPLWPTRPPAVSAESFHRNQEFRQSRLWENCGLRVLPPRRLWAACDLVQHRGCHLYRLGKSTIVCLSRGHPVCRVAATTEPARSETLWTMGARGPGTERSAAAFPVDLLDLFAKCSILNTDPRFTLDCLAAYSATRESPNTVVAGGRDSRTSDNLTATRNPGDSVESVPPGSLEHGLRADPAIQPRNPKRDP